MIRKTYLSIFAGIISGVAATWLLYALDWANEFRAHHLDLIWILPIAGVLIGWLTYFAGEKADLGADIILFEAQSPKEKTPTQMAPFIFTSSIVTHIFGGSAGREGAAVQICASLTDQLSSVFRLTPQERRSLLMAGAGAGFGTTLGTPIAGAIFGIEIIRSGRLEWRSIYESFVTSFSSFFLASILHAPISYYPKLQPEQFSLKIFLFIAISGVLFGLAGLVYSRLVHFTQHLHKTLFFKPFISSSRLKFYILRSLIGGIILVVAFQIEGSYRYTGLGIPIIYEALKYNVSISDPIFKIIFTAITMGSGFRGGQVIPLIFVGSSLGSALSVVVPVETPLLASIGFVSVFAGAANVPLTCTIMAGELFGIGILPYAITACYISFLATGKYCLYPAQAGQDQKYRFF